MSTFDRLAGNFGKRNSGDLLLQRLALLNDAETCCQEGEKLLRQNKSDIARQYFEKAVALDAKSVHGWFGRGMALIEAEEFAASLDCFRKVIKLDPELPIGHANLGRSLHETGQSDRAYECFRRALELDFTQVLQNVAVAVPGFPSASNRTVLQERRKWAARVAASEGATPLALKVGQGEDKACLRIGYVSAFFHRENWMKPVWALVARHDREKFQVHLFSDRTELTGELRAILGEKDRFHDISGLGNRQAAEVIRDQEIDILVDLNGYSYPPRFPLFLWKPAPLVIGWFNMYATTGFDCFDYLVGDDCVIPAEEEAFYCEKIVRVPGSYLTFKVDYPVPDVSEPPCLSNGYVTFGSLISQYKITGGVIDAWSRILTQNPDSRLLIRNASLGKASNREFMLAKFMCKGIDEKRLSLQGPADHFEFLQTYDDIDIALDAFPYNGGTTTTEAIWQGVPVVAYWGDRWVSRTSATLLRAAGLDSLVADDVTGYVRLATRLAGDPGGLKAMRLEMRERLLKSAVCDTVSFARSMERLYLDVWKENAG